jgi:adenine-specific DNA methylase
MDNNEEAIINKYQKKDRNAYENLLYGVFKECHRVLKPGKWMVMTFNNKESSVWMALLRAARRAGFYLPEDGIIYQEPIKH